MTCGETTQQALADAENDLLSILLANSYDLLNDTLRSAPSDGTDPKSEARDVLLQRIRNMVAAKNSKGGVAAEKTSARAAASDDATQLLDNLQVATQQQFLTQFGYVYNGIRSSPPDLLEGGNLYATEDFVSVKGGDTVTMTNYVDETILGPGSDLPDWFIDGFTGDLLDTMTVLFEQGNLDWRYEPFKKAYTDPDEKNDYISVDAIMTYATGAVTVDGQTASSSILYYAGVYYQSKGSGWRAVQGR